MMRPVGRDIIVLGGSAGAALTIESLLRDLPRTLPASVFIALHRGLIPDGHDTFTARLARTASLVTGPPALDRHRFEPGHAYVAPFDHHLLLENGVMGLELSPREIGDIGGDDGLTGVNRQPAGQRVLSDLEAVHALGIGRGHAGHVIQLGPIGVGNVKGTPRVGAPLFDRGADQAAERSLERRAVDGRLERFLLRSEPDLALPERGLGLARGSAAVFTCTCCSRVSVFPSSGIGGVRKIKSAGHRAHCRRRRPRRQRTIRFVYPAEMPLPLLTPTLADAPGTSGSWSLDIATGKVSCSPAMLRVFDVRPADDWSTPDFFFGRIHPDDRQRVRDLFEACVARKTDYRAAFRLLLPDGTVRYQESIGHPVVNAAGELIGFSGIAIDTTEEAIAKGQLERAYSRLTPREREVLPFVVAGFANKQTAFNLGTSEITIGVHRGNIMKKMDVRSLADLVRMADALGIPRRPPPSK